MFTFLNSVNKRKLLLFLILICSLLFITVQNTAAANNCCIFPINKDEELTSTPPKCVEQYCGISYNAAGNITGKVFYSRMKAQFFPNDDIKVMPVQNCSDCTSTNLEKIFEDSWCCRDSAIFTAPCRPIPVNAQCKSGGQLFKDNCNWLILNDKLACTNSIITTDTSAAPPPSTTATAAFTEITPQFSFLPKSILSKIQVTSVGEAGKETYFLTIDWLANFIVWAYTYAVGLGAILAVLMFMYAGVLYIVSGGDPGKITKAKDIMKSTATGLVLFLSAYLILNYINPALVAPKPLTIEMARLPAALKCPIELPPSGAKDAQGYNYCFNPKDTANFVNLKEKQFDNIVLFTAPSASYSTKSMYEKLDKADDILNYDAKYKAEVDRLIASYGPNKATRYLDLSQKPETLELKITSASRTLETQSKICECYQKKLENNGACPPGCGACALAGKPSCSKTGHLNAAAVDLTLTGTINGKGINCGTVADDTNYNCRHTDMPVRSPDKFCTEEVVACQETLALIMELAGFRSYSKEWWHFWGD